VRPRPVAFNLHLSTFNFGCSAAVDSQLPQFHAAVDGVHFDFGTAGAERAVQAVADELTVSIARWRVVETPSATGSAVTIQL
jgi:hypothetical protein